MAASERHGGGVTLARILGDDLGRIREFIHLSWFAQIIPPADDLKPRSVFLDRHTEKLRKYLGTRLTLGLFASLPFIRFWMPRAARRFLRENPPPPGGATGVVVPQGLASLLFTAELRKVCQFRYITWIMDDHLLRRSGGQWRYPAGVLSLMERHLKGASHVFVISERMREFYREKFGVESEVLFSGAEPHGLPLWDRPGAAGSGVRTAYFGRLEPWQEEALAGLAKILHGEGASIDIFSPIHELPPRLTLPGVHLKGFVSHSEVADRMREYDAVLLPMSFLPEHRNVAEFNILTKMTECLASGTVTLLFAPRYSAMVQLLSRTGAAAIVTEPSSEQVHAAIARVKNSSERVRILRAAAALISEDYSLESLRQRWFAANEKLRNSFVVMKAC